MLRWVLDRAAGVVRWSLARDAVGHRVGFTLCVGALCLVQLVLGWKIAGQVNHDTEAFDQGSYILMADIMEGSWFPWYSDGTRNPLIPWIAQIPLDPAKPGFFEQAKRLNVLLGVLGTGLLAVWFRRRLAPLPAWNASALASLALLLPSSTFFGAETLFFSLFLFVFILGLRLLTWNPLHWYVGLGLLAGLASLAKPSVTPLLGLIFFWSVVRLFLRPADRGITTGEWSARRLLVGSGLVLVAFFTLMGPRMVHASQTWGNPFYSLPSYWMWADDWESCVKNYRDCRREVIEAMPPEERPTPAGYFLRNTPRDAMERLWRGVGVRVLQFLHPERKWRVPFDKRGRLKSVVLPHRGFYLVGLGLLTVAMGAFALRRQGLASLKPMALPMGYFFSVWVLYLCATAWYLPTGPGHRFILTLYLPSLWALSVAAENWRAGAESRAADTLFLTSHLFVASLLVSRIGILIFDGNFQKISFTF